MALCPARVVLGILTILDARSFAARPSPGRIGHPTNKGDGAMSAIKWRSLAVSILCGLSACANAQSSTSPKPSFDTSAKVVLPDGQRHFENINPAIRIGPAYGDKSKGAHGTFGRFPGEFMTPFHTHTGAYHGVMIKGQMTNPFKDEKNPPSMGPGSYWYVPINAVHATACISKTPCEFYFHADSGFDFHVAK
jgi:hypothetical protein